MTWISVDERLPEPCKAVLVWVPTTGVVRIALWRLSAEWTFVPGGRLVHPSHWAELPEGPKQ